MTDATTHDPEFIPFEILLANGSRMRCNAPGYRWRYARKPDKPEEVDQTRVEILHFPEGGRLRVVKRLAFVIAAGEVTAETCMLMPRERRFTECPRCHHLEPLPSPIFQTEAAILREKVAVAVKALMKIKQGTEDETPPFRVAPVTALSAIARDALRDMRVIDHNAYDDSEGEHELTPGGYKP